MGLLMLLCRHRVGYTDRKQRGREKRGEERKKERKRNEEDGIPPIVRIDLYAFGSFS